MLPWGPKGRCSAYIRPGPHHPHGEESDSTHEDAGGGEHCAHHGAACRDRDDTPGEHASAESGAACGGQTLGSDEDCNPGCPECHRGCRHRTGEGEKAAKNRLRSMFIGSRIVRAHLKQPRNVVRAFAHQFESWERRRQTPCNGDDFGMTTVKVSTLMS